MKIDFKNYLDGIDKALSDGFVLTVSRKEGSGNIPIYKTSLTREGNFHGKYISKIRLPLDSMITRSLCDLSHLYKEGLMQVAYDELDFNTLKECDSWSEILYAKGTRLKARRNIDEEVSLKIDDENFLNGIGGGVRELLELNATTFKEVYQTLIGIKFHAIPYLAERAREIDFEEERINKIKEKKRKINSSCLTNGK